MRVMVFLLATIVAVSLPQAALADEAIKLGPPITLPVQGIKIALPTEFKPGTAILPFVLNGASIEANAQKGLVNLSVSASPRGREGDLRQTVQEMANGYVGQKRNRTLATFDFKEGKVSGCMQVRSLSESSGEKGLAIGSWRRVSQDANAVITYHLMIELYPLDPEKLEATAKAVVASVQEVPLAPPLSSRDLAFTSELKVAEADFLIGLPAGWSFTPMPPRPPASAFTMGVASMADVGSAMSLVIVAHRTNEPALDFSKKENLDLRVRQLKKEEDVSFDSYRAVQIGTRVALEGISKETMCGGRPGFVVQREMQNQKMNYLFTLLFDGNDPAPALATMDKILEQFKILSDESSAAHATTLPVGK